MVGKVGDGVAASGAKGRRSCIVCGRTDAKKSLLRIVRDPSGSVDFDETGRKPGRGAYVCSRECFERARDAKRFDRSLKVCLDENDYGRIAHQIDARRR